MKARTTSFFFTVAFFSVLTIVASAQGTEKRILLEEFSTARCGFCPDGGLIAEQIVRDHPSVIWVTHHSGFGVDSMTTEESKGIAQAFTNFAPSALIDRGVFPVHVAPYIEEYGTIATTRSKWDSVITAHLGDEHYAQLTITSGFSEATNMLDCSVDIVFSELPEPGDIRVNLFVVEDSVIGFGTGYDQTNYFDGQSSHPYYQAGNPIVGFAHTRVVSAVPTGTWGVPGIIPSQPETGVTYTYTWEGSLEEVWDACNAGRPEVISLVAFISYYDADTKKRQVLHAAEARITTVETAVEDAVPAPRAVSVNAYPNPTRDRVRFVTTLPPGESGTLMINDAAGRPVTEFSVVSGTQQQFPVASLPAGLYFYRLLTRSRTPVSGKLLILP